MKNIVTFSESEIRKFLENEKRKYIEEVRIMFAKADICFKKDVFKRLDTSDIWHKVNMTIKGIDDKLYNEAIKYVERIKYIDGLMIDLLKFSNDKLINIMEK